MKETHDRLMRVMLASGVSHVVASQWNVDSATTMQYMESFYHVLLSRNDIAEAALAARRAVGKVTGKEHPYYWAAFVVFAGSNRHRVN